MAATSSTATFPGLGELQLCRHEYDHSVGIARGLGGQSKVTEIQDFDGSIGGPIKKDKLWFLITGRKQTSNLESPGSFYPNGSPGIELDHIYDGTIRLAYQINPKLKATMMWTRDWKYIGDDIVSGSGGYNDTDPLQSSDYRKPVMYYIMQGESQPRRHRN